MTRRVTIIQQPQESPNSDQPHAFPADNSQEVTPLIMDKQVCTVQEVEKQSCIICFGNFTKRHPAISIPCQGKCNDTPVHAKCIFEWKETKRIFCAQPSSCPLCRGPLSEMAYSPPDPLNTSHLVMFDYRKSFVTRPVPRNAGVVRCYIKAIREESLWCTSSIRYELYLQAPVNMRYPNGPLPAVDCPQAEDRLLLVARKRGFRLIDITLDELGKDFEHKGDNFVGRVKSSFSGLEHTVLAPLYDQENNAKEGDDVNKKDAPCFVEIGSVKYTQNRIGRSVGPRRMQVCLPKVVQSDEPTAYGKNKLEPKCNELHDTPCFPDEEDEDEDEDEEDKVKWATWAYLPTGSQSMKLKLRKGADQVKNSPCLLYAYNKQPYWLDSIQAYSLDFSGRVTLPSNKNFQLVLEGESGYGLTLPHRGAPSDLALQFGKVREGSTEVYTMDLQFPLSPVQSFGMCLSALTSKLACA